MQLLNCFVNNKRNPLVKSPFVQNFDLEIALPPPGGFIRITDDNSIRITDSNDNRVTD